MPELKFLCIADSHGVAPDAIPEGRFDAVLHAGDVDDQRALRELERMARRKRLPLMYVMGNHDAGLADPESAIDLTGRATRVARELIVAGIGCAVVNQLLPTEKEIAQACEETTAAAKATIRTGDRLILLSHYAPTMEGSNAYSTSSAEGVLSPAAGTVVRQLKPLVVVHGHVHALQLHQERWRGTLVACAGPDWGVLTVDAERGRATYCPWV